MFIILVSVAYLGLGHFRSAAGQATALERRGRCALPGDSVWTPLAILTLVGLARGRVTRLRCSYSRTAMHGFGAGCPRNSLLGRPFRFSRRHRLQRNSEC